MAQFASVDDVLGRFTAQGYVADKRIATAVFLADHLAKPLLIEGIDEATLAPGDLLWTSGIRRSAFPGDLYVGRVTKVGKAVDGVPRVVEAEPAADLTSRYVRVVLKDPPK